MMTTSSPGSRTVHHVPDKGTTAAQVLRRTYAGFTLMEMMMVVAVIAIALGLLVPALGPGSGRAVEGAARQFSSDLENARAIAIAERTRTRILLPASVNDFANPTTSPTPWPSDIHLRGYVIASADRTTSVWKQRGKWTRLPNGVAFDPASGVFTSPTPTPTPPGATPTPTPGPLVVSPTGSTSATYEFSGPYIEFLANGSSSLDPTASPRTASVADGFVDGTGKFNAKNQKLRYQVAIDPLSGSTTVK
jgi:prepilin-type N-terminal cleavage/methylation domain-containing protein